MTAPCYSPIVEPPRLMGKVRQMAPRHAVGLLTPICYFINVTNFLRAFLGGATNPLQKQCKGYSLSLDL